MTLAIVRFCLVLFCVVLGAVMLLKGAWAQETPTAANWTRLPGTAVDISINSQGQAYVVAPDGTPWRWDALEQRWRKMSGDFVRISAAEGNRPWAVNAEGAVFRYNGLWWESKDTDVADVAADAQGNVYIAKVNGDIKKWNPLRSEWQPVQGQAYRIALDMAGNPWAVTRDRRIAAFDGKNWGTLPGRAVDIAIGGNDTVVIADAEGRIRVWNDGQRSWQAVVGVEGVTAAAATPDGGPWAVLTDGVIMATTLLVAPEKIKTEEGRAPEIKAPLAVAPIDTAPVAIAPGVSAAPLTPSGAIAPPAQVPPATTAPVQTAATLSASPVSPQTGATGQTDTKTVAPAAGNDATIDPVAVTTNEDITFVNTQKTASALAIGRDGSVFGLDAAGNVLRWSNSRKQFESFPGTLVRLAVDALGNPWGISTLGRVFRHTGNQWKQITGATGSDIAIGGDGSVVIADASGTLSKLNDAMTRFDRISGQGLLVAVAPDGIPWTIRSDQLVQRCASSPCEIFAQKAKSIAIGPDGSVYVVSDKDLLMLLDTDTTTFDVVRTPGHTPQSVAVGPNGYPWLVTKDMLVLASKFFERDEQADRLVAASTVGDTTGTGDTAAVVDVTSESAFTFSKNISFDTFATNLNTIEEFAVGQNDDVYVYGQPQNQGAKQFLKFNSTTEKFEEVSLSFNQNLQNIDVASDGTIWTTQNGSVYQLSSTGSVRRTYSVTSGSIGSLSIGADGTVYVVISQKLYQLKPGTNAFTKFSNDDVSKVAIGRAGDVWIADSNNNVQQFTGTKFENRPRGQSVSAEDVGAGTDGSIYITSWSGSQYVLKKWNATNNSFDTVKNTNANKVDVVSDGRPWIANTSSSTDVKRAED
ncbi:hypothetical protein [Thalassospira lucentensis]|uniref:hypothetical protein n=1 Tax=Thalassospira lucentensis TaxID=168935 RepID=UPI003D2B9C1E|tara:strand:+ start:35781 stop:38375 length:2595 start_codon:yes stop_codon:yes gene_type:complete